MKRILCFGDSNTWGFVPMTALDDIRRYPTEVRWGRIMEQALGQDYTVLEEGNPGRTTLWDDPIEGYKNGKEYLIPCLFSHEPLDLVILMLGTNDLKHRFSLTAFDIAQSAGVLVDLIQDRQPFVGQKPQVLLIAPPPLGETPEFLSDMFLGGREKSLKFSQEYRLVAESRGCAFFDAGTLIAPSEIDGIHYSPETHRRLGLALAEQVKGLLEDVD